MGPSAKILIVEDSFLIAEEMRHTLATGGYEVVGATGRPAQAMMLAEQHHPDVAIINLGLADWQTGAATALRLHEQYDLHILICTGFPASTVERAGLAELVSEVVSKPYSAATLLEAVAGCLARAKGEA